MRGRRSDAKGRSYLGEAEDGTIKMMTTQPDPAEIIYYLENAKYAILAGGLDDDEGN